MKIICSQPSLNKALSTVQKAITNRTTIPILKGILIETTEKNTIKLTATDSEICIERECECIVEESGSLVVSSKLFVEMIRKLPEEDITIEEKEGTINIKCRKYQSDIVALPSEEFPSVSQIEEMDKIVLNRDSFRNMIRKTSFAASTDESRGVLTGVLITVEEGCLTLVAVDGFRLAINRIPVETDDNFTIIISSRVLNEISKILSEEDVEEFTLTTGEKNSVFNIGNTKVTTRLLEGNFIDYNEILPKSCSTKVIVNRRDIIDVIERASLVAREGNNNNLIRVNISKEDGLITIASRSEAGKIKEELNVEIEGEGLEIGFNSKYVLDVMRATDDDEAVLELNSSLTPCMVKPVEGNSYEYLVLPVRL